jgi:acyl-CoA thioesterase-1
VYRRDHHELDKAIEIILEMVQDPSEDRSQKEKGYLLWGNILSDQKKYDEAAAKYQKATELNPNHYTRTTTGPWCFLSKALIRQPGRNIVYVRKLSERCPIFRLISLLRICHKSCGRIGAFMLEGGVSVARKESLSNTLCGLFLTVAALICGPLTFSQGTSTGAPVQNLKPPEQAPAAEQLTPYQKSQLERTFNDWSFLAKYREANKVLPPALPTETRVVFMGDSITEGWGQKANSTTPDRGEFFPGKPYVNRGISGQTTPQMLVRFRQDVVLLKPKVVVLLAGTNDIAENTGKETLEEIGNNIASMSELARANGIGVVLCSVLPASDFHWHRGLEPAPKIRELNAWIKEYAAKNGFIFVDYYSSMANNEGGLKAELSPDGVHPNKAGYDLMAPLAETGIAEALKKQLP